MVPCERRPSHKPIFRLKFLGRVFVCPKFPIDTMRGCATVVLRKTTSTGRLTEMSHCYLWPAKNQSRECSCGDAWTRSVEAPVAALGTLFLEETTMKHVPLSQEFESLADHFAQSSNPLLRVITMVRQIHGHGHPLMWQCIMESVERVHSLLFAGEGRDGSK